jgi:general secretion pathway protein C
LAAPACANLRLREKRFRIEIVIASMQRFGNRRLVGVVNWVLAIVCALLLMRLVVVLVDGVRVDFEPIPLTLDPPESHPIGDREWRLFGEPVEPDYGFDTPLPPTPLQLRLRGVVTGERGYAIIVDGQGDEGVYRAGDSVPGAAEVVRIQPRRVVLERAGTREALELPGASGDRGPTTRTGAVPSRPDGALARGVGIGSLASMTSRFRLDPEVLARRITILPVAGGGFRVRAGRDAAVFTQLGFHANDIVLAINGQPVSNRSDVSAVFGSIERDEPLAITVRRGDRQIVLTPDLSNLAGAEPR